MVTFDWASFRYLDTTSVQEEHDEFIIKHNLFVSTGHVHQDLGQLESKTTIKITKSLWK